MSLTRHGPARLGSTRRDRNHRAPATVAHALYLSLLLSLLRSLHRHSRVTRLAYLCLLRYASCENSRSSLPRFHSLLRFENIIFNRVSIFTFLDETPCEISTCPTCQGCSRCGCISAGPTSTVNRLPRSFSSIVSPPSDKLCPFARETTSPSDLCPPIPSFRLDNSATRSRRPFAPPVPTLSPSLFLNIWGRGGGEGRIVYRSRRITIKENLLDRSPIVIVVVRVSVSSPLSFIHR